MSLGGWSASRSACGLTRTGPGFAHEASTRGLDLDVTVLLQRGIGVRLNVRVAFVEAELGVSVVEAVVAIQDAGVGTLREAKRRKAGDLAGGHEGELARGGQRAVDLTDDVDHRSRGCRGDDRRSGQGEGREGRELDEGGHREAREGCWLL